MSRLVTIGVSLGFLVTTAAGCAKAQVPTTRVSTVPRATDRQPGVQRNLARVSRALDDIGAMASPRTPAGYDKMVAGAERMRSVLRADGRPLATTRRETGSRRRDDLARAANRLFLALGDLRITARSIPDPRVRASVLQTLDEMETQQWVLRDSLGLPHSLSVDEAIRHQ